MYGLGRHGNDLDGQRRRAQFESLRPNAPDPEMGGSGGFSFVQISDSHIGFNKAANPDVTATLQEAIGKINALERTPDFLIHTGDLSHLSKPS